MGHPRFYLSLRAAVGRCAASRVLLTSCLLVLCSAAAISQTTLSNRDGVSAEVRTKLAQRLSLDLRDATLLEALFTIRDASGLNIVVGNEVTGTVNASYANSHVYDILDSLLITRGYGYRVVGESLAVVPLANLGDQLPLFETKVIGLMDCTPADLLPSVESMLSPEGRAHAIASSNSMVVVDYPDRISKIRTHIDALEQAAANFQNRTQASQNAVQPTITASVPAANLTVKVFQPQYVRAEVLAEAITPLLSPAGQVSAVSLEDKLIVSDQSANVDRIASALTQLDRPRPQVRIWAMIYDCGIEDLERLGVNWGSRANGAGINSATGNPLHSIALNTTTSPVAGTANGLLTIASLNRYFNLESVIQALNTADDSRLLADPNVVVMNHEAAEIAIVTEVPYQQLTQGLQGGTIGTTEFREAGVTLNVTPHIAQDETIALLVNPQFSLLTGFSEPDNAPIIDRRETKTTVRVANNQTIVLGGLRQRTRIANRATIPVLGSVPYIGHLFRNRSTSARESELLVFITPQIIKPDYMGTPREDCLMGTLKPEMDQTPTSPIPFGIDAMRAENQAVREMLKQCPCRSGNPSHRCGDQCRINQTPQLEVAGMIHANQPIRSTIPVQRTSELQPVVVEQLRPGSWR